MENKNNNKKVSEFFFEIDKTIEGGVYSNMANVIHSKNEFLIDFAIAIPGKNAAKVQSRVILSTQHAKQLLLALQNNIAKYESIYGEIKLDIINPSDNIKHIVH